MEQGMPPFTVTHSLVVDPNTGEMATLLRGMWLGNVAKVNSRYAHDAATSLLSHAPRRDLILDNARQLQ